MSKLRILKGIGISAIGTGLAVIANDVIIYGIKVAKGITSK
jgi:hypothetical protein